MLLRLGAGIPLILLGALGLFGILGEPITITRDLIAVSGGIFLLAGLWTPVLGGIVALNELWIAYSHPPQPGDLWVPILLAVMSGSLAMLGPGAWSIDAYLFGRKRFDIGDRARGR